MLDDAFDQHSKDLSQAIAAFWEWDPAGLAEFVDPGHPLDDYDELAKEVLSHLKQGVSPRVEAEVVVTTLLRSWGIVVDLCDAVGTMETIGKVLH